MKRLARGESKMMGRLGQLISNLFSLLLWIGTVLFGLCSAGDFSRAEPAPTRGASPGLVSSFLL